MISRIAHERSHLELSTIYEVCRILGDSLDLERTFRAVILDYSGDDRDVEREILELHAILSDVSAYQ